MDKIKLGIIGCGLAAEHLHLPALQKLSGKFKITQVCNHTEPKARRFAKLAGNVPWVLDYHQVLANPDVDAVLIALPIELNYRTTLDAVKAGKHVLLEKPLAANLEEARKMLLFNKLYKSVMMVAENFRFHPMLLKIKEIMRSGEIGNVFAASWNVFSLLTFENKYAQTKWRIDHKYPGGFITDAGVHYTAGLRLLFGEIIEDKSFFKSVNPAIGSHDTWSYLFRTALNISGTFNLHFSVNGLNENELVIFGDSGTIRANIYKTEINILKEQKSEKIFVENDIGYYDQLLAFYDTVRKSAPNRSDFKEAYRDLELIISAME